MLGAPDCLRGPQNRGAPWDFSHLVIWPVRPCTCVPLYLCTLVPVYLCTRRVHSIFSKTLRAQGSNLISLYESKSSGSFLGFSIGTTIVLRQLSGTMLVLIISLNIPSRYRFAFSAKNLIIMNFIPSSPCAEHFCTGQKLLRTHSL
jgi:hypothetical protein